MAESQEMKIIEDDAVKIRISEDNMTAWLLIKALPDGEPLRVEEVRAKLSEAGVKQGILTDNLEKLVKEKTVGKEELIAVGRRAVDGENGWFEFFVDTEAKAKPIELPDGTVDYTNVELFIPVSKGQLLVRYHKATKGSFGFLLTGQLAAPKQGKDLPQIKGKGFDLSEDKLEYRASFEGCVDYKNEQLTVSHVFTVLGDLDMTVGNVHFSGDVEIKGDVARGMQIEAGGSVVISGHVAAASIVAGEDIVLKGGMQGEGTGTIKAGGKITGKFIESAIVECNGDFQANYILNCNLAVGGKVVVSGRRGAIIGGKVQAMQGIAAAVMGNTAQIPTVLAVGPGEKASEQLTQIKKAIKKLDEEVNMLQKAKEQIEAAPPQVREKNKLLYERAVQTLTLKQTERGELEAQENDATERIVSAQSAKVVASGNVHPGVTVWVALRYYLVKEMMQNVSFIYQEDDIAAIRNV